MPTLYELPLRKRRRMFLPKALSTPLPKTFRVARPPVLSRHDDAMSGPPPPSAKLARFWTGDKNMEENTVAGPANIHEQYLSEVLHHEIDIAPFLLSVELGNSVDDAEDGG